MIALSMIVRVLDQCSWPCAGIAPPAEASLMSMAPVVITRSPGDSPEMTCARSPSLLHGFTCGMHVAEEAAFLLQDRAQRDGHGFA
jgi:hypothetical protein